MEDCRNYSGSGGRCRAGRRHQRQLVRSFGLIRAHVLPVERVPRGQSEGRASRHKIPSRGSGGRCWQCQRLRRRRGSSKLRLSFVSPYALPGRRIDCSQAKKPRSCRSVHVLFAKSAQVSPGQTRAQVKKLRLVPRRHPSPGPVVNARCSPILTTRTPAFRPTFAEAWQKGHAFCQASATTVAGGSCPPFSLQTEARITARAQCVHGPRTRTDRHCRHRQRRLRPTLLLSPAELIRRHPGDTHGVHMAYKSTLCLGTRQAWHAGSWRTCESPTSCPDTEAVENSRSKGSTGGTVPEPVKIIRI